MNKIRWQKVLGVGLPIIGIVIDIWDGINQANLQEQEMKEFEEKLVAKYNLEKVEGYEDEQV